MASATARLLKVHPFCCFCGGTEKAENRDHQPAKILFPGKYRPQGMEFASCKGCNGQTSGDEALMAVFARAVGNARLEVNPDDETLVDAMKTVNTFYHFLLGTIFQRKEMFVNGILRWVTTIDGNHSQVRRSACRLAAKLGLAMYYEHFGKSAPATVRINTMWSHSQNKDIKPLVDNLLKTMPKERYLKQGKKWDTQGTFFMRYHVEGDAFTSVAVLHQSIALIAHIADAGQNEGAMGWDHLWMPEAGKGIQPFVAAPAAG